MSSVTQAVSQSAISNGLKILNTLDGVVSSENGNKNQRKIWSTLSKEQLKVNKIVSTALKNNYSKVQQSETSSTVV